jgi:hypothetical protein
MQPYEFGMRVGLALEKQAAWGDYVPSWDTTKSFLFGTAPLVNQIDPMQRGVVQHVAAYSNPLSGVPMAVNDTARHLYNGRYLSALGSVGEGALSFLPGAGFAAKGVSRGLAATGARLTGAGAATAGKALTSTANALNTGRKAVYGAERAMAGGIQKVLPKAAPVVTAAPNASRAAQMGAATRNLPTSARNFFATKPLRAAAGGYGPLDPMTAGSVVRGEHMMTPEGRAYQQYMQRMSQPQIQPQMPRPQSTFRPKPMGTF